MCGGSASTWARVLCSRFVEDTENIVHPNSFELLCWPSDGSKEIFVDRKCLRNTLKSCGNREDRRAMSASESSSDDDSDVEVTVRQRPTFSATKAGVSKSEAISQNADDRKATTASDNVPQQLKQHNSNNSSSNRKEEKWDMSSSDDREDTVRENATESQDEGSVLSVTEQDIGDFMLLVPDYAYSDPETEPSRQFRLGIRSIPRNLIDTTDPNGNTMLLIACQFGCQDLVRILLQRGASPHVLNDSGANALHFACYKDSLSVPIAELLLERRVAVNVPEKLYGCTPLHYAASAGNLTLCKLLIANGAYIHAQDYDGCDSVAYAKDAGQVVVVNYLSQELTLQSSVPNTPVKAASPTGSRHRQTMSSVIDTAPLPMAPTPSKGGSAPATRMVLNDNFGSMDSFEDTYSVTSPLPSHSAGFRRVDGSVLSSPNFGTGGGGTPMRVTVYDYLPDSDIAAPVDGHRNHSVKTGGGAEHSAADSKSSPGGGADSKRVLTFTPPPPPLVQEGEPSARTGATLVVDTDGPSVVESSGSNGRNSPKAGTGGAKKTSFQPTDPSPYKPLSPSLAPHSRSSGGSSGGSGGGACGKGGNYSPDAAQGKATSTSSGSYSGNTRTSPSASGSQGSKPSPNGTAHSALYSGTEAGGVMPPLPPTMHYNATMPHPTTSTSPQGHYGYLDSSESASTDSPTKYDLYIERAKFNARLQKEQAQHRDIVASKDGRIQNLQTEVKALKQEVWRYKVRRSVHWCASVAQ